MAGSICQTDSIGSGQVPLAKGVELCPPRGSDVVDEHVYVTIDEVRRLAAAIEIPDDDLALRRDRAGAALLYVSGMRAGAFGTLPIGCR